MANLRGPAGPDGQRSDHAGGAQTKGLSPERLAELRQWLASGRYADPETDLLIAKRILEQGDL